MRFCQTSNNSQQVRNSLRTPSNRLYNMHKRRNPKASHIFCTITHPLRYHVNTDTIQLRSHYKIPLQEFYRMFRPLVWVHFLRPSHIFWWILYKTSSRFAYDIIITTMKERIKNSEGLAPMVARRHYVFSIHFFFFFLYSLSTQLHVRLYYYIIQRKHKRL